jgi:hypothetical protein
MAAPVVQVVDMLWAEAGHGNVAHLQAGAAEAWPPAAQNKTPLRLLELAGTRAADGPSRGGRSGRAAPFCFRRVFDRAIADILTKPLDRKNFERPRNIMMNNFI